MLLKIIGDKVSKFYKWKLLIEVTRDVTKEMTN